MDNARDKAAARPDLENTDSGNDDLTALHFAKNKEIPPYLGAKFITNGNYTRFHLKIPLHLDDDVAQMPGDWDHRRVMRPEPLIINSECVRLELDKTKLTEEILGYRLNIDPHMEDNPITTNYTARQQ